MICYCTNIWNHHQGPTAQALAKACLPGEFMYLLHQPLDCRWSKERLAMGWNLIPPDEPWIMGPPKTTATADYAEQALIARNADVLIYSGNVPYVTQHMLLDRRREGKLSMRMGERFFKKPLPWYARISPKKWLGRLIMHYRYGTSGVHFLTMGHGCAEDLDYYWACEGRTWRWGYFIATSHECCTRPVRDKVRIGWCGRMLDWKHVDYIIRAVALLPPKLKTSIDVRLVGDGDQEQLLKNLARECEVDGIVMFSRSVSSADALAFMRDLDIYVFAGNRREGWGAALLEAMDKGCAVVANEEAGATLEVVEDGVNGFTFKDGNIAELCERLARLITDSELRDRMGRKAWQTIQNWSPQIAAGKLLELIKNIQRGTAEKRPAAGICGFIR